MVEFSTEIWFRMDGMGVKTVEFITEIWCFMSGMGVNNGRVLH